MLLRTLPQHRQGYSLLTSAQNSTDFKHYNEFLAGASIHAENPRMTK